MKKMYLLLLVFLTGTTSAFAQVAIGSQDNPQNFSILELISDTANPGGLRLPQMTDAQRDAMTATADFQNEKSGKAMGLTIYNTTIDCVEFWDGTEWVARCEGNSCQAPDMPGVIIFSKPGPLKLNETFQAQVDAVAGITYHWTVPSSLSIVGSNVANPVTFRALSAGNYSLANVGVTATNDCGSTSSARSGNGAISILNCEAAPTAADIDLSEIETAHANSGTGTASDPYLVTEGNSFMLDYPGSADGIEYEWTLNAAGRNYFEIVSSGNGTITLRARSYNVDGAPNAAGAIRLTARNDCGEQGPVNSGIRVKIVAATVPCEAPEAPGTIAFSTSSVMINEIFEAVVPQVEGMTYTWSVPAGLAVVGSFTANPVTIKALTAGNINRSGIVVTATNDCGNTSNATQGSGILTVKNPEDLSVGTGTFSGKTCFDVVETNFGDGCGERDGRLPQKANFAQAATNTQTYTFTTDGTVSKIRFVYINADDVIESITPGSASWETGTGLNGTYTVTVKYKTDLNAKAAGTSREAALKAALYVVYNNNSAGTGTDRMLKLDISVQDCICCPGYLAVGGEYTPNYSGYLDQFGDGTTITTVKQYFTATGKDVCFYKTDGTNGENHTWTQANNKCNNGDYIDAEHRGIGEWRLPTLAELGAIHNIHTDLASQPNSSEDTENLRTKFYRTSTLYSKKDNWLWQFQKNQANWGANPNVGAYVRCACSF